jgi:hypothetical protein
MIVLGLRHFVLYVTYSKIANTTLLTETVLQYVYYIIDLVAICARIYRPVFS